MKKLIILLLISLPLYAQVSKVSTGQAITAEQINKIIDQLIPIGTVYHSLLTPAQFIAINGNCWKLMDSSSSLVGTDLGALTLKTALPPAASTGAFLRQITGIRELGSYESDELASHSHGQRAGGSGGGNTPMTAPAGIGNSVVGTLTNSLAAHTNKQIFTDAAGGAETKPKNIGINLFVKVNKVCNF